MGRGPIPLVKLLLDNGASFDVKDGVMLREEQAARAQLLRAARDRDVLEGQQLEAHAEDAQDNDDGVKGEEGHGGVTEAAWRPR